MQTSFLRATSGQASLGVLLLLATTALVGGGAFAALGDGFEDALVGKAPGTNPTRGVVSSSQAGIVNGFRRMMRGEVRIQSLHPEEVARAASLGDRPTGAMNLRGVTVRTSSPDPTDTLKAFRDLVDGTDAHARLLEFSERFERFVVHVGDEVDGFSFDADTHVLNVPRSGAVQMGERQLGSGGLLRRLRTRKERGALREFFSSAGRESTPHDLFTAVTRVDQEFAQDLRRMMRMVDFDGSVGPEQRLAVIERFQRSVPAEQARYMAESGMRIRIVADDAQRFPGPHLELTLDEALRTKRSDLVDTLGRYEGQARRHLAERAVSVARSFEGQEAVLHREAGLLLSDRFVATAERAGVTIKVATGEETGGRTMALGASGTELLLNG
ncbi:MAG: hypothetical protein KC416_16695, partial [Myxococcales bacterium]|nr:hypothetical protein [Myxococcales bacterium]